MNFHVMMRRNFLRFAICLNLGCVFVPFLFAQTKIVLDLQRTIELANDSSLEAFRVRNLYLSGYWETSKSCMNV
jgi:hypothetical protein